MSHNYKNKLQEYTQREHLGFPVYTPAVDGPPHEPQFKSTVIVNDKSYATLESFRTRKEAEQAAAKVACEALLVDAILATTEIQATTAKSSYKNLLQEYAQKKELLFPTYQTFASGLPHKRVFISTVEIEKHTFQGAEANTKKQAEMDAAKVAYCTLTNGGCLATNSSEVSSMDECLAAGDLSQNIQPTEATKKHQDTSYEDPYLHAKRMKPSTESMDVNTPQLRHSLSIGSNVIIFEGKKTISVLPQVDNSFRVPAHPITNQPFENEPLLHVNTPPPINFPSTLSNVNFVTDNKVENSIPLLPPVENSSHDLPSPLIIEQAVEKPVLPVNTPPPNNFPYIVSNVVYSQVENSLPMPVANSKLVPALVDSVSKHTIQDKLLPQRTSKKTLVYPRKSNLPIPEGATMMPFSDDKWVAYEIDQNHEKMV